MSGDLAAFGGPAVADDMAGFLRAEQMTLIRRNSSGMMVANICNATVLMLAMSGTPLATAATWWGGLVIFLAGFYGLRSHWSRRAARPQSVSRRAIHRLVGSAALLGTMWAVVPGVFSWTPRTARNSSWLVSSAACWPAGPSPLRHCRSRPSPSLVRS